MAGGFAKDGAVSEQIDATVEDGVRLARSRLPRGQSLEQCAGCGNSIPQARRDALPGVRYCVSCQSEFDKQSSSRTGINRRGSKDSQLR